mmetsp:Transcript_80752/g.215550  ORF Transcript_80752/g.215550 Transcript_80752/m.215550 type:complete len:207 (+) Transcript_80752:514-1134(+)
MNVPSDDLLAAVLVVTRARRRRNPRLLWRDTRQLHLGPLLPSCCSLQPPVPVHCPRLVPRALPLRLLLLLQLELHQQPALHLDPVPEFLLLPVPPGLQLLDVLVPPLQGLCSPLLLFFALLLEALHLLALRHLIMVLLLLPQLDFTNLLFPLQLGLQIGRLLFRESVQVPHWRPKKLSIDNPASVLLPGLGQLGLELHRLLRSRPR